MFETKNPIFVYWSGFFASAGRAVKWHDGRNLLHVVMRPSDDEFACKLVADLVHDGQWHCGGLFRFCVDAQEIFVPSDAAPFESDFVRGVFDGVGSAGFYSKRRDSRGFRIPKFILYGPAPLLDGMVNLIPHDYPMRRTEKALELADKNEFASLYRWLYRDAERWLPRKRLDFQCAVDYLENMNNAAYAM